MFERERGIAGGRGERERKRWEGGKVRGELVGEVPSNTHVSE